MFCDSQSAIHLAKNQVYHARTKHIDVRYHFVREIIEEGGVLVQKIKTDDNSADMLTKVVTTIKFNHCLDTVALSTMEAEYMTITEAIKEAIWLQGLLDDLGVGQKQVTVFCDSQSAIHLAKNQVYHARTKHIDVRYHFVREIIEEGGALV